MAQRSSDLKSRENSTKNKYPQPYIRPYVVICGDSASQFAVFRGVAKHRLVGTQSLQNFLSNPFLWTILPPSLPPKKNLRYLPRVIHRVMRVGLRVAGIASSLHPLAVRQRRNSFAAHAADRAVTGGVQTLVSDRARQICNCWSGACLRRKCRTVLGTIVACIPISHASVHS